MSEFDHGLLIGKFYPPRLGHHAGIRLGAARCRRFTVLVMASVVESIPLQQRVSWLREEHRDDANVEVLGIRCDAPMDVTDEQVWTAQVAVMQAALRAGGAPPVDAVFCGDDYGDELARRFGAKAVRLDRYGSSTAVRGDLAAHWDELAPVTRAGLATRVVVVGAESSGTTTVARLLAEHYAARGGVWARTRCVAEYGREYTMIKHRRERGDPRDLAWGHADFDVIGPEQTRQEEEAARAGSPLLVCDTDAFATSLWERRYLGAAARTGQAWMRVPPRAVYLITDHEGVPWEDDGWREGDLQLRAAMTQWFIDALTAAGHSWVLLTGELSQRVDVAIRTVDPLLELAARFGEPLHGPGFEGS
jgi:NadR type nicotinamide-nucleotide adenylyltransferase